MLSFTEYENHIIRPSVGLTSDDSIVEPTLKYLTIANRKFTLDNSSIEDSDEEVTYLGRFIPCWGHCITTNLMYLWVFLRNDLAEIQSRPLVYVTDYPDETLPQNMLEIMRMLGIDPQKVRKLDRPTRFRRICVPDPCYYFDEACGGEQRYTPEYLQIIDELIAKSPADKHPGKVYFTRTRFRTNNRDFGEKQIETVFRDKGYEVIAPETLSLSEMIAVLQGCSSFAATEGSVSHNAIFLKEGTECIYVKKINIENHYQNLIDRARALDVTAINANASFLLYHKDSPWGGPFFMYCNKDLRKWAGRRYPFPFKEFLRYVNDWVRSRCKFLQ